jgi:hypothetical protein
MAADPTQLFEGIEFVNEQERIYFSEAVLGEEAQQFLSSSVGRFLWGCAKSEYDRCRDRIFEIDPYTPEGKREYEQMKADAWAAQHFIQWCVEAIDRGNQAETMLERSAEERESGE